jgi:hypothetical protein
MEPDIEQIKARVSASATRDKIPTVDPVAANRHPGRLLRTTYYSFEFDPWAGRRVLAFLVVTFILSNRDSDLIPHPGPNNRILAMAVNWLDGGKRH